MTEGKIPIMSPHPADHEPADIEALAEGAYDKTHKAKHSPAPSSGFGMSLPIGGLGGGGGGGNGLTMSRDSSVSSLNSNSYSKSNVSHSYRVSSNISGWNRIIFSFLTKYSPATIKTMTLILLCCSFVLFMILPLTYRILVCIYTAVCLGVLGSLYLSRSVLECDDGTEAMRAVSDPIREGAEGFLSVQYSVSYFLFYIFWYRMNRYQSSIATCQLTAAFFLIPNFFRLFIFIS